MFERLAMRWVERLRRRLADVRLEMATQVAPANTVSLPDDARAGDLFIFHATAGDRWPARATVTTQETTPVSWMALEDAPPPTQALCGDRWRDNDGQWWRLDDDGWRQL